MNNGSVLINLTVKANSNLPKLILSCSLIPVIWNQMNRDTWWLHISMKTQYAWYIVVVYCHSPMFMLENVQKVMSWQNTPFVQEGQYLGGGVGAVVWKWICFMHGHTNWCNQSFIDFLTLIWPISFSGLNNCWKTNQQTALCWGRDMKM